jgi:putative molybdopterin biosynthesis protein
MFHMSIYLHDVPLSVAKDRFQNAIESVGKWGILGKETIPLNEDAMGRTLAEPVWAKISSPHYHASAMDGFAVRSEETSGATQTLPVRLAYGSQAVYVDTGDPLPPWANAVIMIENVESLDEDEIPAVDPRYPLYIRIRSSVPPWMHVRPMGEDMVATQLVLPAGHVLRAVDLGAIAGCGHDSIRVSKKPRVAIIPTGTELVPIGEPVRSGEIIEYNSLVMAAQINAWGGEALRLDITPDVFEEIQTAVLQASKNADLILLNAGSSAGSEDFSAEVVDSLGELLVHGVAVRPGHPVILGMIPRSGDEDGSQVPIIGVPGYPVSAALTGEIFVEPLIAKWLGRNPSQQIEIDATLTRKISSPAGDDDYVRMAVGKVGDRILAAPLSRGSGVITSLVRADGIAIIPSGFQGIAAGELIKVRLFRSPEEIENTIFAIGSHDISLDVLAQFLTECGRRFSSASVGSLGGLVALRRGEAHLAGSHLLDPQTGEYNMSYIDQYLPGVRVKVISYVRRDQGLMISQGNPKKITSLEDLVRDDVSFINRQRGAGTRVLLDYHLEESGILPGAIRGYQQEEYTHLAVAAAVASGRADCGFGIAAAASALELDFIPLFQERYDLIIPNEHVEGELLSPLFDLLQDHRLHQAINRLPGYDTSEMGDLIADQG